ncbi:hypothetical protein [Lysobacter enzymogenes]|uniref:hypothetical protein n=1 Tax=Lysobacter enzymogenes TaxID=69 RepID=UPI000045B304|nr:hypothetical protein [Lysobacter enzymogenes]
MSREAAAIRRALVPHRPGVSLVVSKTGIRRHRDCGESRNPSPPSVRRNLKSVITVIPAKAGIRHHRRSGET